MSTHYFSFEGGEILSGMGATWFVSYAYYEKVDFTHRSWEKVPTSQSRIYKYNKSRPYHRAWLQKILEMNPVNLNKNTIGIEATQTKAMAKAILEKLG